MTISLPFTDSSLEKCIATYLKEDFIHCEGDNTMYKCEKCNSSTKARIKTDISHSPKYLLFHLKRFQFPSMKKITNKIKFPLQLSLQVSQNKSQYELFGVTKHIGTLNSGHYVAFVKREKLWYLFNDEMYQSISESEVLQQEAYLLFYKQVD